MLTLLQYINYWFDSDSWHVRCVNPAGGKINPQVAGADMELACSIGDNGNP